MAAFNFPNSPSTNDTHSENNVTWKWDGTMWNRVSDVGTTLTQLNVTGVSTFAGAVNIAGVLTYEDVKNVDSVGIITARTGLSVTAGDVVIPDSIIHSGDTNTKIRFPAADTITAETAGSEKLRITSTGIINIGAASASGHLAVSYGQVGVFGGMYYNGSAWVRTATSGRASAGMYVNTGGHIAFITAPETSGTSATISEKLRITSGGNLLVGTTTDDQRFRVYNGNGATGYKTALFDSNSTHGTRVVIANSNNTSGRGLGIMVGGQYVGTDKASFGWFNSDNTYVSANLMTIQSDGKVGINSTSPNRQLSIHSNGGQLDLHDTDGTTVGYYINGGVGQIFCRGNSGSTAGSFELWTHPAGGSVTKRLVVTSTGNLEPSSDNTYNFGSLTKRWANLYTADINLSNEGSKNDVDGTWGQYTIQEGQDDLFLINNRSGKKYKFNLTEVS
jgi:hypothetical protein